MRDRTAVVREFPQGDGKTVEVTVSYHKGGLCRRGYWMHIQPMRIESSGGCTVRTYFPADGYRTLVMEATRFSKTGFAQATAMAEGWLTTDDAVRCRIAYAIGALATEVANA